MKKILQRGCCLLLVLILCCSMLPFAGAAKNVVLTAVNDSFLPLSNSTMPTRQNGEYYVPYSVFSGRLGVRAAYSGSILSLSSGSTTLTFNTTAGTVYDQNMNSYSSPAYLLSGTVYVPVRLVCGRFGYSYSTLHSGETLILRICNSTAGLSDSEFLSSSSGTIRSMLNNYNGITTIIPNTPGTTATNTDFRPSSIGFAIIGAANDATPSILSSLNTASRHATFFLPVNLDGYDNALLRTVAAGGHSFGFLIQADALPLIEDLTASNQKLFQATGMTTRLLMVETNVSALTAAQRDLLTEAGYRLWDATHIVSSETRASQTVASLTAAFGKINSTVVISLPHAEATGQVLRDISSYMNTNTVPPLKIKLLTTPVNQANDRR